MHPLGVVIDVVASLEVVQIGAQYVDGPLEGEDSGVVGFQIGGLRAGLAGSDAVDSFLEVGYFLGTAAGIRLGKDCCVTGCGLMEVMTGEDGI